MTACILVFVFKWANIINKDTKEHAVFETAH